MVGREKQGTLLQNFQITQYLPCYRLALIAESVALPGIGLVYSGGEKIDIILRFHVAYVPARVGGFGIGPAGFGTQGVGVGFFFDHNLLADLVGAFAEWQGFGLEFLQEFQLTFGRDFQARSQPEYGQAAADILISVVEFF